MSVADLDAAIDRLDQRVEAVQARWILALAVSNAAGLTALGSKVFDIVGGQGNVAARELALAMALPSLWFFVVGIAAAGISHVGSHLELILTARGFREGRVQLAEAGDQGIVRMGPSTLTALDWAVIWFWEAMSALAFIGGLIYPLIVIGIRYFQHGGIHLT